MTPEESKYTHHARSKLGIERECRGLTLANRIPTIRQSLLCHTLWTVPFRINGYYHAIGKMTHVSWVPGDYSSNSQNPRF